jgi:hypothetical protein
MFLRLTYNLLRQPDSVYNVQVVLTLIPQPQFRAGRAI